MENYTVIKRLGDGSQGVTHLCTDKRGGRQVVVKKMPSGLRSSEEINVTIRVKHPNIIECLETFTQDDYVFMVMRYADGGDLETLLERCEKEKKPITVALINRWIGQLCRALSYCHESRIMHRDIKPSNIFLSKDLSEVYLGDFGVAKQFHGAMNVATTFVGSPIWLSPEVISGTPYGCMSDVWSLGCVFYELVTLKKPFAAGNFAALVMRICSGQFDPLPSATPTYLSAAINGMLNIDVNERWLLTDVLNSSDNFAAPTISGSNSAAISSSSNVDLSEWAKAKLRDIATLEKYVGSHRANDAIILQKLERLQTPPQMLEEKGPFLGANLNPDRAKRMLPSPSKGVAVMGLKKRCATPPEVSSELDLKKRPHSEEPHQENRATPMSKPNWLDFKVHTPDDAKIPKQARRPASGQPSIPDIPTPPSKEERREAQRQDIKAMIREQRARAAAAGGDISVEILLPTNLKNLPQNKV